MFKYGGCTHVYVDKHSKEGAVYVKSKTIEAAMLATKVFFLFKNRVTIFLKGNSRALL